LIIMVVAVAVLVSPKERESQTTYSNDKSTHAYFYKKEVVTRPERLDDSRALNIKNRGNVNSGSRVVSSSMHCQRISSFSRLFQSVILLPPLSRRGY
jgi:hypothetical protein